MLDQLYCSIDLEFTGFDPSRDQILEIGFAFFRMSEKGARIVDEWSQVFKPNIEVHPKILGLTGITREEIAVAPELSEFRDFLQEKLRNAILVAHNPAMDIKFLEAFGFQLSGKYIDTLELVQFLLPTHHSYNLENLMHYFGVKHDEAHRALEDCRATIAVLEACIRLFQSFSPQLQQSMRSLFEQGLFVWKDLLDTALPPQPIARQNSIPQNSDTQSMVTVTPGAVIVDPFNPYSATAVANGLQGKTNQLLVVRDNQAVMQLWQVGLVHGVFETEHLFDQAKFEALLASELTHEQIRFCLKVLVWLHTNWQTETILDLNLTFFGGQFKPLISGGAVRAVASEPVVCCSYATFRSLAEQSSFQNRELVIVSLHDFERFVSSGTGTKLSWNGVLYMLRMIYSPETNFGNQTAKSAVLNALAGADLFFGLVNLLVKRKFPQSGYITIEELIEHDYIYRRITRAAKNFQAKLQAVTVIVSHEGLQRYSNALVSILESEVGRVRWLEPGEHNSSFHDQPLDIAPVAQRLLGPFHSLAWSDTSIDTHVLQYAAERLGQKVNIVESVDNTPGKSKITYQTSNDPIKLLLHPLTLPVVVLFEELADVKAFYDEHFLDLKQFATVLAQGYSGGGNKIFRNFGIRPNAIMLATPEFILKHQNLVNAKTVIFTTQLHFNNKHPYLKALQEIWKHKDISLAQVYQAAMKQDVITKTVASNSEAMVISVQNVDK